MTIKILILLLICISLPCTIYSQNDDDDNDDAELLKKRALPNSVICFDSGVAYLSRKRFKLGKQKKVATPHSCQEICAETSNCNYWIWQEKEKGKKKRKITVCKLLSGVRKNGFRRQKDGAVSGTLLGGCNPEIPECGLSALRIVGGSNAPAGSWPWAAILGRPSDRPIPSGIQVWCGGSLITKDIVLTAAHCFDLPDDPTIVRLGETDITTTSDGSVHQDIEIERVTIHPLYDAANVKNDIAIIKLNKAVDFTRGSVGTVCLPYEYTGFGKIESLVGPPWIIGWGKLDDDLPVSNILQEARVPVVGNPACNSAYSKGGINIDEASQICAGIGNIDTCAGDSGGPMLSNELSPLKRYSVIGITSFGVQCADANFPGVYTRVDNYLDWISQNLQ